MLKINLNYLDF